jgi:hypothetical protein
VTEAVAGPWPHLAPPGRGLTCDTATSKTRAPLTPMCLPSRRVAPGGATPPGRLSTPPAGCRTSVAAEALRPCSATWPTSWWTTWRCLRGGQRRLRLDRLDVAAAGARQAGATWCCLCSTSGSMRGCTARAWRAVLPMHGWLYCPCSEAEGSGGWWLPAAALSTPQLASTAGCPSAAPAAGQVVHLDRRAASRWPVSVCWGARPQGLLCYACILCERSTLAVCPYWTAAVLAQLAQASTFASPAAVCCVGRVYRQVYVGIGA